MEKVIDTIEVREEDDGRISVHSEEYPIEGRGESVVAALYDFTDQLQDLGQGAVEALENVMKEDLDL